MAASTIPDVTQPASLADYLREPENGRGVDVLALQVVTVGSRASERIWRVHGGEVVIRTILPLSLTFDHRALDGAEAQRFLNELIAYLSNPARLVLVL